MLIDGKLEEFPMFAIRLPIGVHRVWMRSVVLLSRKKLSGIPLLEFDDRRLAEKLSRRNELTGDLDIALMIAAYFSDHRRWRDGFILYSAHS